MTRKKRRATPPPPAPVVVDTALARARSLLSAEDYTALVAELEHPLRTAIRLNPLKAGEADLASWAVRYGWETTPVPYCPTGWWLNSAKISPAQTPEHRLGCFYIQDAASMLPVELFDFGQEPGLLLDLAASPGGKTTHLISRTHDRTLTIANDASASRIQALRIVLGGWGTTHQAVTNFPGEKFGNWFPGQFDGVLLDAPCSMESLRSTESHPMRPISTRERSALAQRQARLLTSALLAVRNGGQVVYSTCTLAPEEDEAVLDIVLQRFGRCVCVDDLSARLPGPAPALPGANGVTFDPQVTRAARLWPHRFGTSGFFAARLTRLNDLPGEMEPEPARPLDRTGWARLAQSAAQALKVFFGDRFGFDLENWLTTNRLELWGFRERRYAIPVAFLARFASLPVQMLGLLLGEDAAGGFEISHEAAARLGRLFQAGRVTLPEAFIPGWLKGDDLPHDLGALFPAGAVILLTGPDGQGLGRGRVGLQRVKNLLPRRMG